MRKIRNRGPDDAVYVVVGAEGGYVGRDGQAARGRGATALGRSRHGRLTAHTAYLTFETDERREFVRITDEVQAAVDESGIAEGMVLVSAMHITAGVWVNDDEPGIQADTLEWLDKLAPPSWQPARERRRARALPGPRRLPPPSRRRGQRGRALEEPARPPPGRVPVTAGRLDLGPWQAIFYIEFDGRRAKRLVIKVLGE